MPYPDQIPYPLIKTTGASAGRPAGKGGPIMLPAGGGGFEMNEDYDKLKAVETKYIEAHEFPDALKPKNVKVSTPLNTMKSRAISKGWRNPRGVT